MATLDGIVALSPDGRLAVVVHSGRSSIVRVPSGRVVAELRGSGPSVWSDAVFVNEGVPLFSPDDTHMLTQSSEDNLRLWNAVSGEPLARLGRPGEQVDSVSFSARGQLVLVAFDDRAATFDASSGTLMSSSKGPENAISSDGTQAATAGQDGSVAITNVKTGIDVSVPTDTARPLSTVSFGSTDGLLVAMDDNGDSYIVHCQICAAGNACCNVRARCSPGSHATCRGIRRSRSWTSVDGVADEGPTTAARSRDRHVTAALCTPCASPGAPARDGRDAAT